MHNSLLTIVVLILSIKVGALEVELIKKLDSVDVSLSKINFTTSENFIYQRVPDLMSRQDVVNIYETATGKLAVSHSLSRDVELHEVVALEKLGKFLIAPESLERRGELGNITLLNLKTGKADRFPALGADYAAVNETKQELYIRKRLAGKLATHYLKTGKSTEIPYNVNHEAIVYLGGKLMKITHANRRSDEYAVSELDGKGLGTFATQKGILFMRPPMHLLNNRFLWIMNHDSSRLELLADLKTGGGILSGDGNMMVSGLSDSAKTVAMLDTRNSALWQFDVTDARLTQLGALELDRMDFATGFHMRSDKVRVSTYQREVIDIDLKTTKADRTGKLKCEGLVTLSPNGNYLLCSGKGASWWRVK